MQDFVAFYLRVLVALVAICDPLGNMPIFVSLTGKPGPPDAKETARVAGIAVLIVFVVFSVFGERILGLFSISMGSFRAAGGILLVLMGVAMLHATPGGIRRKPEEVDESAQKEHVAVVPLAIPLLSGPGAMSTVILYSNLAEDTTQYAALYAAEVSTALVCYIAMRMAAPIVGRLGHTGINIVTRVMGLVVVAIGVQFMADGLAQLFPVLASVAR